MIQVNATNDAGIDTIEIHLPSGEVAYPMKNKLPYQWNWDSTSVADGTYAIKAVACDHAGHCGSSEVRIFVQNAS
jgi:hypothetical protein